MLLYIDYICYNFVQAKGILDTVFDMFVNRKRIGHGNHLFVELKSILQTLYYC